MKRLLDAAGKESGSMEEDQPEEDEPITVSEALPASLREAALAFIAPLTEEEKEIDYEDLKRESHFMEAFGLTPLGGMGHRQATWLCVLAARRTLPGWTDLECEGDAPARAVEAAEKWVLTGEAPDDWEPLCTPEPAIRDGYVIDDCTYGVANSIAEVAAYTARFACTGDPAAGGDVLFWTGFVMSEGLFSPHDPQSFDRWLLTVALPAAYALQPLSEQQLYS